MKQLKLRAYSDSTIRTYRGELMISFRALGEIAATRLTTQHIKRYRLKCLGEGLSKILCIAVSML